MSDTRQETQAEREPRKKSRWYRALFWLLALVVLVPVLLVTAVLLALRSETGTAWVLEQVPGLDVSQGQGSLLGEWRAEQLRWHGYGVRVEVVSPYIDWSPSCLFQKQLCLESLRADSLAVQTQPSGAPESDQQGIDLPDLNLPLALRVSSVELGELVLNGAAIWDSFSLSAQGSGADWQLDHVSYQRDELGVTASGRVETRRDWPVELNVSANLPPPVGNDWNIDLNLGGSIHDLRVSGHSQGYLEATFSGKTSPLDPQLPAELRITSERFLAHDSLPATLELRNWTVDAKGSLEAGFRTRGNATLPGTEGPVDLSIQGLVTTSSARDVVLSLMEQTPDSDPGKMTLNGRITWQDGLEAGVDLSLRAFPWFTLLPDVDAPPVVLEKLNGTASWSAGNYHANLDAEVSGPQGPATLSTVIDGDLERTRLTDLSVTTGAGTMEGRGSVDFSGPLSWQAGLTLDEFNPGYWVPLLEAQLSGAVETRGSLGDGPVPDMSAAWDLSGQWRQKPAHAEGKLDASSGQWMLSDLSVSVGDNRLAGKGTFGDNLSGDVSVELPSPGDLLAGLSGNINGNASISGTLEQPLGSLNLQGQGLGWQNRVEAGQLEVTADLKPGLRLVSRLQAENIEAGGQQLESLSLAVEGTQQQNALSLTAVHQDALLELALGGGFGAGWQSWNGRLVRGMIDVPAQNQRWDLEAPASLDYQAGGKFLFGAHCWRWNESSVCAGDQTLLPDPSIAYRISHFPTEALAPSLPETLKWKAWIDGDIEMAMTPDGPDGRLRLDAGKGDFRVLTDGEWQTLQHDALSAQLVLKPRNADLGVQLAGPDIGELSIDLTVDPQSQEKNVDGRFRLEGFDFSLIGQLAGLQEVAGDISGEGTITGPLMKPAIEGQIALSGGRVVDHRLPIPIEEAVASIDLNGYSADLSARIQSNARSQTILDGTFDWRDKPKARIRVSGNRVPFSLEPYARVELAPDLIIELADSDLSVSGEVKVPRGSIEIKGLPSQAVSVSDDEVIVGVAKEEPTIRTLNMDVTVVVGEDQVTFSAFGVQGDLEGTLRIGNDLETRGTLQLVDGQYEAFGQELELRRARLLFVGNLTQPYLDIEAVRTVDTVVAGIRLSGPVQSPSSEVFSNPDMPQTDALSYVILGRAPQSQGDEGQMSRAALSLGLTQASKVTGKVGEELGIQNLMLEAEGSGEQTSVVASGYLTDELSVRYGVGIFEPITTVALRYDLGRYFYLEAASGLAASLDIFYTRDF